MAHPATELPKFDEYLRIANAAEYLGGFHNIFNTMGGYPKVQASSGQLLAFQGQYPEQSVKKYEAIENPAARDTTTPDQGEMTAFE